MHPALPLQSLVEVRTGLGWDSHRTAPGRPLVLAGVAIEADFGLEGHSDADVLAHAVTDALLGAAALGDIGMHFPDTDPHLAGLEISNVDATVILERPKLKSYRTAIRESLSQSLGIPVERVSVKFKTAEKMGPVGQGLSAEAQAVATLVRRAPR
jgi:2C-methyl-D-erythritol 2,4-cyclodiphosphate synthase